MKLDALKGLIPDYGRDIRLNLESVLNPESAPGLTPQQLWGVALSCAYSLESKFLVDMVAEEGAAALDDTIREAARGAATIMAMNNVYYRAMHLIGDADLKALPARLRMNVIGKPGIPKADFELMCFAISAIAGCGQCMSSHLHELHKASITNEGAQSALKIAAVLQAAEKAIAIGELAA